MTDRWFDSVKCALELMKRGMFSFRVGNTWGKAVKIDKWAAFLTTKDDVKLQACRFKDPKTKGIILACSSILPGNPRQTKHAGTIPCPPSIDIHHYYRCGSTTLEDI